MCSKRLVISDAILRKYPEIQSFIDIKAHNKTECVAALIVNFSKEHDFYPTDKSDFAC